MGDPKDDDEAVPPDVIEADAFGDRLWEALRGAFVVCAGCGIPWRDRVCAGCGWFPDPVDRSVN